MGIISGVSNVGTGVGGIALTFGVSIWAGAVGFDGGALGVAVAGPWLGFDGDCGVTVAGASVGFGGSCGALGVTAGSGAFAFSAVVNGGEA